MSKLAPELRYAVRGAVVCKYVGQLCVVLAVLNAVPLIAAACFGDMRLTVRLALMLALLAGAGAGMGRMRVPSNLQQNEALVIACLIFLIAPVAMIYPLMSAKLSGLDAFFEAVSGVTTTGLSTVLKPGQTAPAFLFTRAWMQWYGGLGIVVLSLALVVPPGLAAKGLAVRESNDQDLVGGTRENARRGLWVYGILTVAGVLGLILEGVKPFDSLLYTLAAVSTGGFGVHNAGLTGLHAWLPAGTILLLCVLGALPLAMYHRFYHTRKVSPGNLLQVIALLAGMAAAWGLLVLCAWQTGGLNGHRVLHDLSLLAVSAQTTAGFSPIAPAQLDSASKLVLIGAMLTGGAVGSTAGGFKLLRLLLAFSLLRLVIVKSCLSPHAEATPRLWERRLGTDELQRALLIILLFIAVALVSWFPFVLAGYNPLNALFEVASATGTVGLTVGITSHELAGYLKGILCADMLFGRLEIIAWLVLFFPGTWFGERMHNV